MKNFIIVLDSYEIFSYNITVVNGKAVAQQNRNPLASANVLIKKLLW